MLIRPGFPGATFPVLRCKFDKVQVHITMSNQHICKEATPTASKGKKKIAISPFPSSAFRSQPSRISHSERSTFLTGYTDMNARISVSRLPDFPESQVWPFFVSLAPGASFLFSPRPPPPRPASSLPDAPLSLQGPPAAYRLTHGPKARHMHRAPAMNEP